MIVVDANEFVTELAVSIVGALGRKLAEPLRTLKDRHVRDDLEIATWLDTYKLTEPVPLNLPPCPRERTQEDLKDLLGRDDVHAVLYELLAARLTDAPERDIARLRNMWQRIRGESAEPWPADYLAALFDALDLLLAGVVGRLEGERPKDLVHIRSQARAARITAILGAIERHVEVLAGEIDITVEQDFLDGYRRHLVDLYGAIELPDFNQRRRIPVQDIYVSPGIAKVNDSEPVREGERAEYISMWELADKIDRVVLLGDPGCGKTTASRVLMHYCAVERGCGTPFLVTLREFATDDPPARSVLGHLEHDLEVRLQHPAPTGLLRRLLMNGSAVVVFDGLDELLDPARRSEVSAIIERFCAEYPLARVLVTSRVVGYDQARLNEREFTRYRIYGFEDNQVGAYVEKWFAQQDGLTPQENEQWASAFVEESEAVSDLRSNPLLLSLMCILYRGEGSIPRNRCDVYERCADLLFRRWDSHRRIRVHLAVARDSDAAVRRILRHLAYWLLTRDDARTAVTEKQLVAETVRYLTQRVPGADEDEAREAAVEFIAFCRGRAWVFTDVGTTAGGEELYTFTHRTFLEYFAAQYISFAHATPEKLAYALAPKIAREQWPVVAVLAVQIKDQSLDRGAERVLMSLLDEKRRRSDKARIRILSFIAECLPWVPLPVAATHRLTVEIADRIMAFTRAERREHASALAMLTTGCWLVRNTVRDALLEKINSLSSAADEAHRIDGVRLAANLPIGGWGIDRASAYKGRQTPELATFWFDVMRDWLRTNMAVARQAGMSDTGIFAQMFFQSSIDNLGEFLRDMPDLTLAFRFGNLGIYRSEYIPVIESLVDGYLRDEFKADSTRYASLVAFAKEIDHRGPKIYPGGPGGFLARKDLPIYARQPLARDVFLVFALEMALAVEWIQQRSMELPQNLVSAVGPFAAHVTRRLDGASPVSLPELPISPVWQEAFDAWARQERDFTQDAD